ncbi:MAG: SDR family oxidoreductase [Thermincolia bacterium]
MILVTGANGLTGKYILPEIAKKYPDKKMRAIVRSKEKGEALFPYIQDYVVGDLSDGETIKNAMSEEINIVIHIAGIRFSLIVLEEARKYAKTIDQIIFIHTTGMYSRYSEYSKLYKEIENQLFLEVKKNNIPYTILRPTMIYGSVKDKNINKLISYLATKKVFPLFGQYGKMQPIFYKDLGNAVVASIYNERSFNKEYNLSGGSVHTYGEIVRMVRKILNSKILILPIPYTIALSAGWLYEQIARSPRISLEQIRRLSEDKVYDHSEAGKDLGFNPVTFQQGVKFEINEYYSKSN